MARLPWFLGQWHKKGNQRMSLAIDPESVSAVLMADGWHEIERGTFRLDAYEYLQDGLGSLDFGSAGFCFDTERGGMMAGSRVAGPLTSILAVLS
jgi:hypothetical protein